VLHLQAKEYDMLLLERNALVTISPNFERGPEGADSYRWTVHVSLPFPFPSSKCIKRQADLGGNEYEFSIHNHFNRMFLIPKVGQGWPCVTLIDNKRQEKFKSAEHTCYFEVLQSVAIFKEATKYDTCQAAFAGADKKIKACFDYLSEFLANCQINAPYLTAWLVYPISLFDVGTIYHSVEAHFPTKPEWRLFTSAPAISIARRLQHPLFQLNLDDVDERGMGDASAVETANELLAEAQMSLFRGLPRLTVLNAYGAVEALANAVFRKRKIEMLLSHNVPLEIAEPMVEEDRQRHRTEPSFLYHSGLKSACGRSLMEEDKDKYDKLLGLQKLRHEVAHKGIKLESEVARDGHRLACECTIWLSEVGGFRVKPLLPSSDESVMGFSASTKDAHAVTPGEFEFLKRVLGLAHPASQNPDRGAAPN
jgi:hypothetical protein